MSTCHAMDGHGWAQVDVDGYGLGMDTNSKEMLSSAANPSLRLSYSKFHRLEMKDLVVLAKDEDSVITPAQKS